MLNYEQFYNWCNNKYKRDTLYKVYKGGYLIGLGFYNGVNMRTLEDSICILKNVTFIRKQCIASSFTQELRDKLDETYQLIPVKSNDIGLISSSIQMISDTLRFNGKSIVEGLEIISNYAKIINNLSTEEIISPIKNLFTGK